MGIASYRLRDRGARCSGPVTVYRAEVIDRPGQLVRLTCLDGPPGSTLLPAVIAGWQEVRHPALLTVEAVERSGDTLLLRSPGATARPLDTLAPATLSVPPTAVARIGEGIAEGLAALHLGGRPHGSVGTHTILLGSEGTAVLDGPWHVACLADEQAAGGRGAPAPPDATAPPDASANAPADALDGAAHDIRALAATLLDLLDATEPQVSAAPPDSGSRSAAPTTLRRTAAPTPAPGDVDALRALLRAQERQPGTARELQQVLRAWRTQVPPVEDHGRAAQDPSDGGSAPRSGRPRGRALDVAHRERSLARVNRPHDGAGRPVGRPHHVRYRSLAIIAGAVMLIVFGALVVARPAPSSIAPPTAASAPAATAIAPRPTHGSTSTPASRDTGPAPPTAAVAGPGDATLARDPRPVCPRSPAPPGRGSLVLADLDGRGCRAAARVDGDRLSARDVDGTVIEVVLGLDPGDQVRVADLDGTGRDEVVVYRPGTGEVFRFAGLAGPGEVVTVRGRASGRIGGTAVIVRDPSGVDRLEIRGRSPA